MRRKRMDSLDKNYESSEEGTSGEAMRPSSKRIYESPLLVEWGSIADLTQGALAGKADFPVKGGTRGV
jgi:hypothetical protein